MNIVLEDRHIDVPSTTLVSRQQVADALSASLASGWSFWAGEIDFANEEFELPSENLAAGYAYRVELPEDGVWQNVGHDRVAKALTLMAADYPHHFNDLVRDNSDAETGDVLFQLLTFGEVIYG